MGQDDSVVGAVGLPRPDLVAEVSSSFTFIIIVVIVIVGVVCVSTDLPFPSFSHRFLLALLRSVGSRGGQKKKKGLDVGGDGAPGGGSGVEMASWPELNGNGSRTKNGLPPSARDERDIERTTVQ